MMLSDSLMRLARRFTVSPLVAIIVALIMMVAALGLAVQTQLASCLDSTRLTADMRREERQKWREERSRGRGRRLGKWEGGRGLRRMKSGITARAPLLSS